MAYGTSQSQNYNTMDEGMDAQVGYPGEQKGGRGSSTGGRPEGRKITTQKMQKDGVKVVVTDGVVTGTALTAEAIQQLIRELPRMNAMQRHAAMKVIIAYKLANPDAQVGALADDPVVQTAAAVDPTGLVGKAVSIQNAIKNLFGGGMKEKMKQREAVIETFKTAQAEMQKIVDAFHASPAGRWANDTSVKYWNPGLNDYNMLRWALDPFNQWIMGVYYPKVINDGSKNKTQGTANSQAALGMEANAASIAGEKTADGSTNIFLIQAERMAKVNESFIKLEAEKLKAKPTQQDLAVAATALTNSSDPKSQNLGTSITTAQNQTGKTEAQAAVDLSKTAQYPTITEGTPVPANTPFVVGYDVGADVTRDVKPGDTVKKGEVVRAQVPVAVRGGVVVKVSDSMVQKVWGTTTGKVGVILGGSALILGGGFLVKKMMAKRNK